MGDKVVMSDMNLEPKLTSIINELPQAVVKGDSVKLANVRVAADEAIGDVREFIQAAQQQQMQTVITKLNQDQALTNDEAAVVEDFFVGDAEAYMKAENNVEEWNTELKRLHGVVRTLTQRFQANPNDLKMLHDLGAALQDLSQTSISLLFFLQAKDRIDQFKLYQGRLTSSGDMCKEERQALSQSLMAMLTSPDY